MPSNFDRESVIIALTEGVGAEFGSASRKSYFLQLERLEHHDSFARCSEEEKQALIDLLAIASFFQTVIAPIRSSAQFVGILRNAGATHLRLANEKLDHRYANRAFSAVAGFRETLSQWKIPEHLLNYSTLQGFIRSGRKYLREVK